MVGLIRGLGEFSWLLGGFRGPKIACSSNGSRLLYSTPQRAPIAHQREPAGSHRRRAVCAATSRLVPMRMMRGKADRTIAASPMCPNIVVGWRHSSRTAAGAVRPIVERHSHAAQSISLPFVSSSRRPAGPRWKRGRSEV
jgi:hypothetical protein